MNCKLERLVGRLEDEACDLRCVDDRGFDDADYHWEVIKHHMGKPHERMIGYGRTIEEALVDAFDTPNDEFRGGCKPSSGTSCSASDGGDK